jgi:hypothetical protein
MTVNAETPIMKALCENTLAKASWFSVEKKLSN